jgi:hypothetical protein
MKNRYADRLTRLLDQTWPTLSTTHRLEFKNVFGAVGGYVNGRIFISCGKFGVALRLPSSALEVLFQERGVRHLKYFPNGHIKKEYGVIPSRLLSDKRKFRKLLTQSISALIVEEAA